MIDADPIIACCLEKKNASARLTLTDLHVFGRKEGQEQ